MPGRKVCVTRRSASNFSSFACRQVGVLVSDSMAHLYMLSLVLLYRSQLVRGLGLGFPLRADRDD